MKKILLFLGAIAAYGTDCTISDTVRTPFGGYFAGKITVVLNSPSLAQPLYSASQTLAGWQTTIDVPASANGAVAVTLVCTDSITPSGTSYAARYQPTSGAGWAETWTPATGTTTIRAMRATTVPTPTVTFQPSQLAISAGSMIYGSSAGVGTALTAGTNGHILTLSGGYPSWATPAACATCVTTAGSYADPAWITSLAGSKITGGLVTGITGTANQITASASTGAVTLSLPATITGLTSVTSTGFTGALTGNASTATALASTVASGRLWIGQGTGVPTSSATICGDTVNTRIGVGTCSPNSAIHVAGGQSIRIDDSGSLLLGSAASNPAILTGSGNLSIGFGSTLLRLNSNGNLLIGTTTDGNYKLEVANSGSSGTLRVYDQTATTGNTKEVIRAGAGQTTNLTEWQNNAGTVLAYVGNTGGVVGEAVYGRTIKNSPAGVAFAFHDGVYSTAGGYFQSTFPLVWNSDAGIKRSAAGYMAVTDGSTGLGKIVVSQSTPSASTDACTAGALWADATYIYACTASGTIKRATLATF